MYAPLYETLLARANSGQLRLHMPGHKGRPLGTPLDGAFSLDFTELPGLGNLYEGDGPIAQAEAALARSAGAAHCLFLPGGSTQGIVTAVSAVCPPGSTLLLDRGCHKSAYTAAALLDLKTEFLFPRLLEPFGVSAGVSAGAVEDGLRAHPGARAVLVVSPTYSGILSDLPAIAAVCHRYGAALIVDQAHGAHLPFLPGGASAAAQGADLTVVSLHKTLPALGSAAALYASDAFDPAALRRGAALFGTSSPSYAVMASMDYARAWLEDGGAAAYAQTARRTAALRERLNRGPLRALCEDDAALDPCRLTVCTAAGGLSGFTAQTQLEKEGLIFEMADRRNLTAILTCADGAAEFDRLAGALDRLAHSARRRPLAPLTPPPAPLRRYSAREAVFAPACRRILAGSAGAVAAAPIAPYPPGIPVVAPGEEITKKHIAYLQEMRYNLQEEIWILQTQEDREREL